MFSCLLLSFVCVDWKTLLDFSSNAHRFSDLISFEKMLEMHWYFVLSCAIGGSIWIGQWIKFYTSLPELRLIKRFYEEELEISAVLMFNLCCLICYILVRSSVNKLEYCI